MKKSSKEVLYTVTILGMLLMLTISSGMFVSSTPKSVQNRDASPIILYTAAENNALRWNTTWGGAGGDYGYGVAVDASGSIYCVGETYSFGAGDTDFALVKFAPAGTKYWNITWGGANYDTGYSVAVDANGSIYCFGYTNNFGAGNYDFALVKFAPNGTKLWNTTWGGVGPEYGYGVAVDANGSIYCVGTTLSFGAGAFDLALVKFAPSGTKLWNRTWGGASDDELGYGIAVDAAGNLYCVGETKSFGAGESDLALVMYDSNGTKQWNITWGGASDDVGWGVAVDISGSTYCVGETFSFGAGHSDFALVKFNHNGIQLWNHTWGGAGTVDVGQGITMDAHGYVYYIGRTSSYDVENDDFALFKLTPSGIYLWNITWGGASDDVGYGVAVDASGSIYCIGTTNSFGAGNGDLALVKFGYQPGEPGGIPGFEFVYLLLGLLALLYLVQRRKIYRTTP